MKSHVHTAKAVQVTSVTRVYALWDSIRDMAADLDESPMRLIEAREAGRLPDPRHDRTILLMAGSNGKTLRQDDLDRMRAKPMDPSQRKARSASIRDWFTQVGGVDVVARVAGCTANSLNIAAHRGSLPRSHMFPLMQFAKQRGVPLDEALFQRPP